MLHHVSEQTTRLFGKVYFPRLAMPISVVFSKLFNFFVQFLLFAAFWAYFALQPGTASSPTGS